MGYMSGYQILHLEAQQRRVREVMEEVERSVKDPVSGEIIYLVEKDGQIKIPFSEEIEKYRRYHKIIREG